MLIPPPRLLVLLAATALLLLAGCGGRSGSGTGSGDAREQPAPSARPAAEAPAGQADDREPESVDALTARATELVAAMPVRERAGIVIMTKLVGTAATPVELDLIERGGVGGIILFGSNVADPAQLDQLVGSLDGAWWRGHGRAAPTSLDAGGHPRWERAEPRLLISVDQEGGPIRNIAFAPPEETQPQLGAAGDPAATRASARAAGAGLASHGIDMSLGPVADLATGPNRTMAGRAFGSDPTLVAGQVAVAVAGLQSGGVAATTKHFPGFGASTANSDEAVAYVDRTAAELRRDELAPFRAAIEAGTRAIMVSHGIHRELGSTLPGTLDPRIATELLRGTLGFEGVAMTNSMNAVGLREAWGDTVPRACPVAIAAGIDMVLLTGSIETARLCLDRIVDAVDSGDLPADRLEQAAVRVTRLQLELGPGRAPGSALKAADAPVDPRAARTSRSGA